MFQLELPTILTLAELNSAKKGSSLDNGKYFFFCVTRVYHDQKQTPAAARALPVMSVIALSTKMGSVSFLRSVHSTKYF